MSTTIRKGEMSRRVAKSLGCTAARGEEALNAVLEGITDAMRAGDRVVLMGFGTFELVDVKPRKVGPIRGVNSGELIEVPGAYARAVQGGQDACPGGSELSFTGLHGSGNV